MKDKLYLIKQALQTYERITRRLELALLKQSKMPPRASRTTAYAAFQSRINQLDNLKIAAYNRYIRRGGLEINPTDSKKLTITKSKF